MAVVYDRYVVKHLETGETLAQPGVAKGETVYECLERNGVPIRTTCRGSTLCGQCVVRVLDGADDLTAPHEGERFLLERFGHTHPHDRLACQVSLPKGRSELVVALVPPE